MTQDPIARHGQDLLYFPTAIPEITTQLRDELIDKYQSPSRTPEQIEILVKRDVKRTFIGATATVVYADLAEHLVPHIRQHSPLITEQIPRAPTYVSAGLPRYVGYADDFARGGIHWLFGAAARVYRRAENPDDHYHPLIKALAESTNNLYEYIAEDPPKRLFWVDDHPYMQEKLEYKARRASTNFIYTTLSDNVKVALEMMLQFGLAYSREEQTFPDGEQLTAAALAHTAMMGRASSIGSTSFEPMVHADPLATAFHHYELTELAVVNDFYPSRESIFIRKDGEYTFRFPPLMKGPKKRPRRCPAAHAWRPAQAREQDAIEELFVCAEEGGDCSMPRPGDGTYRTAEAALILGGFIGRETIYAAWPQIG